MKKIKIWNDSPSEKQIDEIVDEIKDGRLVILPTDSLYGITCDALNSKAISKLCTLKKINPDKTHLSILCSDISMAADYARIDDRAFKLLKENTPGPVTFIFKALSSLPRAFKGRKIVGVRIPDCNTTLEVIRKLNSPLLTTSIEFEDDDFARNPELIAENYDSKVELIVLGEDGDSIPSTIVDCTSDYLEIIRQGKTEIILE